MASPKAYRPATAERTPRQDTEGRSWASSAAVRRRMQRQTTRDTAPELAVRRLLHAAGFRYRVDAAPLPGLRRRADVVFRPARVALFVDGCFWHGCPEHGQRTTRANTDYWHGKVARNQARDLDTNRLLEQADWLALRAWEHEDPAAVAHRVAHAVRRRRGENPR